MQRRFVWTIALVMASAAVGCGDDDGGTPADAGALDAASRDAGTGDEGGTDAGEPGADAGESDAGATDAGDSDAGGAADAGGADAGAPSGGDTCEAALDVTAGATLSGQSTEAATDVYQPSGAGCPAGGAASGRDVVYFVRPAAPTTYRVRVTPIASVPPFDPLLYAVRTCGAPGCVAGTTLNGPGEPEEITFAAAADETIYIVVDGENVTRGRFDLVVAIE